LYQITAASKTTD